MITALIEDLTNTEKKLLAAIQGLSEEQSKFKISSLVWSVHECMEHIVIVEVGVYRILCKPDTEVINKLAAGDEIIGKSKIAYNQADRTIKRIAGDNVKPIGRFSDMQELKDKFQSNRKRIIQALRNNEIVFGNHIFIHPVLGELTKKDWLNFMIHHTERHRQQIEDVKANAGFPAYAKSI